MSAPERYDRQSRGDASGYDRYLAGMDASMRQKVALTAAHLLGVGTVADMGMGSGAGSHALAALYPNLQVIGVDVNPEMVARASARYRVDNLSFVVGDVAKPCLAASSLDAILDSSVLHHVTSFGGYDRDAAARALRVQSAMLRERGVLVVRDFVDPGDGLVWLDVPDDDGEGDTPQTCSTAALFERFAGEFRSLSGAPGFDFRALGSPPGRPAWRRYEVAHRHAVEFVLRKDYRRDWALEVQEEYTYLTQRGFEGVFQRLGLRVLASIPIRNPWIVDHRFVGRIALRDPDTGASLDWPATNYVIVGQKVYDGAGVTFREAEPHDPVGYLELQHYRRAPSGVVYDLVRRPGATVDVVPYFVRDGVTFVLARRSYPRPVLIAGRADLKTVDGRAPVGWVTEPLSVPLSDRPLGQTVEALLNEFAGIGSDNIRRFIDGSRYYPSPGGIQEEVRSVFVEVAPVFVDTRIRNHTGFSGPGMLRAIEARQLLRAAQVGGLPDARLELNVYDLLDRLAVSPGAWIGAELPAIETGPPAEVTSLAELARRPSRRRFGAASPEESSGFLELRCAAFEEQASDGTIVARRALEYVSPSRYSRCTIALACLRRDGEAIYLGVDDDDLPAAQCFHGNSELLVAPAWRLPPDQIGLRASTAWTRERLAREFGASGTPLVPLGGAYHPSAAVTPEIVFPFATFVTAETTAGARQLTWVRLADAIRGRQALLDGHLRVVALRAAHGLGLWERPRGPTEGSSPR